MKNRNSGFTLIELMIVIVILGIIMGLVAPNIIGRDDEARVDTAKIDIQTVGQALEMYKLHNGNYPSTDQGLEALVSSPSGSPEAKNWRGPYLKKAAQDPWKNPYGYINDNGSPDVISYGKDGAEGGEGLNADISTSNL